MSECVFCKIISGVLPSYKIYEDEKYLAFLDVFPQSGGHTLVIPKRHVEWVWDYDDLGEYFEVVGKVARHFRQVTGGQVRSNIYGWNVPHAHIHLKLGQRDDLKSEKMADKDLKKWQKTLRLN